MHRPLLFPMVLAIALASMGHTNSALVDRRDVAARSPIDSNYHRPYFAGAAPVYRSGVGRGGSSNKYGARRLRRLRNQAVRGMVPARARAAGVALARNQAVRGGQA